MLRSLLVLALAGGASCSHLSTVRVQPETVDVGPGLRPIAGIQANAISGYILFIPMPGVDLDKVVNQMLVVAAKSMGADKVTNLSFEVTPKGGIWVLRQLLGWRSAEASGIAVQITAPAPDPAASDGPEPVQPPAPQAEPTPPQAGNPGDLNKQP